MAGVTVGAVRILALSDGHFSRPPERFFPETSAEQWAAYRAAHLDTQGHVQLNLGSYLIRADGQTLLVDTGLGPHIDLGGESGRLLENMRVIGISPEEVTAVLITHMHADHIGWNTVRQGERFVPTFPRARYLIQRPEWQFWMQPRTAETPHIDEDDERLFAMLARPLEEAGVLELTEGEHAVTPSVRFLPSPGHTPGHACFLVSSGGEAALILGDVAHNPAQVSEPEWPFGSDEDKAQGIATRRALMERIEQEGLTLCAGHFPEPGFGRVVRVEGKRVWAGA